MSNETQPLIAKKDSTGDVEVGEEDSKKSSLTTSESSETVLEDVIDILKLAFPIFITSFSWVGVSSTKSNYNLNRIELN